MSYLFAVDGPVSFLKIAKIFIMYILFCFIFLFEAASQPTSVIELYDTRVDKWFRLPFSDRVARAYHGIATFCGKIYMVGGFDGNSYILEMFFIY